MSITHWYHLYGPIVVWYDEARTHILPLKIKHNSMIKLLHLADLHIGIENYGRIDPSTGMHTRLLDYLERLDEAITFGLDAGVDLVLIAGDIYKNRSPNPTHQREFARRIHRLLDAGVPVFILTGNHDISASAGRAHSVEIFHTLHVSGVTIADRPRVHMLETRAGAVQIIALPWVTRHGLLTRDEMKTLSLSEIDQELRRRIETFVAQSVASLDPDLPAVLALHATVDGAVFGAERGITLGQDLVLARSAVAQPRLDYVAMGHIHKHQALGKHPPLVYAGSIERIDFGERQEAKGCVLVELARGATSWQFHPLSARPFVSIEVDVRGSSDPHDRVMAAIAAQRLEAAVARLEVRVTREQVRLLREDLFREALTAAGTFLIAAIVLDVERTARTRIAEAEQALMQGLSPRRALELYLQHKGTDPERIAALLAVADETLADE